MEKAETAFSELENYKKFSIIVLKKVTVHKNKDFIHIIISVLQKLMIRKDSALLHLQGLRLIKDLVA